MTVLTISREFGSGGRFIAKQVAQNLGYNFVDKRIIGNVLTQYGFVEFQNEYDTLPSFWASFNSRRAEMVGMLDRVMQALARHGNSVILGRGSFAVLGTFTDVLNVRIQSPLEARMQWMMAKESCTRAEAEVLVNEKDRIRTTFIEQFYTVQWDAASAFDVVLNTGRVSPKLAVACLVDVVKAMDEAGVGGEKSTRMLKVDPILAAVVADELGTQVAVAA